MTPPSFAFEQATADDLAGGVVALVMFVGCQKSKRQQAGTAQQQSSAPTIIYSLLAQFFFCTDRYSWEWSEDAQQLPTQASDSLCLTMDSTVIPGLEESKLPQVL